MKAKICFENETYKISKLPKTFEELKQLLPTLFRNKLPQSWTLQYSDSDGDNILLASEKEYEDVFGGTNNSSNVIKICIVSNDTPTELIKYKSEDGFQIISDDEDSEEEIVQAEKKEVSKEEKVPERKEPKVNGSQIKGEAKNNPREEAKSVKDTVDNSKKIEKKKPEEEVKEVKPEATPKGEKKDVIEKNVVEKKLSDDKSEDSLNKEVHHGVTCRGCNMKPIVGVRYKCTVCPDFSYCGSCEKNLKHNHHFIKMKYHDVVDSLKLNPIQQEKDKEKKKEKEKKDAPKKKVEEPAFTITKPENYKFTKEERLEQNKLKDIEEKANKLFKCFPKEDICRLLVYVSEAPEDMTFEELVENFKH